MVTHDQDEALTMADRIVIMRDGRIEQVGAPAEVYQRPVSRFVAGFLGASNFLRGRVVDAANGGMLVEVPAGSDRVGRDVTTGRQRRHGGAPAEAVSDRDVDGEYQREDPDTTPRVIEQIIYHGFATHLHLRMPNGEPLIAFEQNWASRDQPSIRPGMQVYAQWNTESGQIVRDQSD